MAVAHAAAQFNALAPHGKLEKFEQYLPKPKGAGAETLDEVMGKWNALASAGFPIKIRSLPNGD